MHPAPRLSVRPNQTAQPMGGTFVRKTSLGGDCGEATVTMGVAIPIESALHVERLPHSISELADPP